LLSYLRYLGHSPRLIVQLLLLVVVAIALGGVGLTAIKTADDNLSDITQVHIYNVELLLDTERDVSQTMTGLSTAFFAAQQHTNTKVDLAAVVSARAAAVAAFTQFRITDGHIAEQRGTWEQAHRYFQVWLARTEPRQVAVLLQLGSSTPALISAVVADTANINQLTRALTQLIVLNEHEINTHQAATTTALHTAIVTLISVIVLAVLITALLATFVGGSEHRFQALMEHTTSLVAVLDARQVCRYASPSLARMLGFTPRNLVGQVPAGLVHPEDLETLRAALTPNLARPGDACEAECRVRQANGTYGWLHLTATNRLQDPIIRGIILTAYDVTARKEAEEALRRSERDYRHLFEHATDAIFMFAPEDGTILDGNDRACALYRLPRKEFIGSRLWARASDPVMARQRVQDLLASREPVQFETTQCRGDGSLVSVEVTASLIEFGGREVVLSINRDVTERAQALQAAEALARMRADFLSSISHELRTPLTAALGFAELLQARWDTLRDMERRERVDRIVMATRRQHHLVDQLLEVVRLDNDVIRVRQDELVVGRLTEEAAEEVCVTYKGAHVQFEGSQTLGVRGDAGRIVQILSNLIDNALKYSPEGSAVRVWWEAAGDTVLMRVRDFGQGIPEEGRALLFTRFGRVPGSAIRAGRVGTANLATTWGTHSGHIDDGWILVQSQGTNA
jgi:PAS domain S-box-containing protein